MWVQTKDKLPPFNKWVLARHNRGTWIDNDDQENVNCVVVKRVSDEFIKEHLNWIRIPSDVNYSYDEFGPDHYGKDQIYCWQFIEKE